MTFYAVEKSLALIEGFIGIKYSHGKDKKGWKTRYVSLYSSENGESSSGTLIICDKNDFDNRSFVFLTDVLSIRRIHLRRRIYAFVVECKDGTKVSLNASSEYLAQKWIQFLRSSLLNIEAPSFISGKVSADSTVLDMTTADENDNNIEKDSFPVAVIDNPHSIDLEISAYHILKVTLLSLSLLDMKSHVTIQQWPLNEIERFSMPDTFADDNNHILSIHVLRDGNKKTFSFFVEDALKIMDLIQGVIVKRLGQTSKKMDSETLQSFETLKKTINKRSSACGSDQAQQNDSDYFTKLHEESPKHTDKERSERRGLLRQKPLMPSQRNAIRSRAHTTSRNYHAKNVHKTDRRVRSMDEFGSNQRENHDNVRGSPIADALTRTFKKSDNLGQKVSDSPRQSKFYVDLVEPEDIPLRKVTHTGSYLHMRNVVSMPDVKWSLEKALASPDTIDIATNTDIKPRPYSTTAVVCHSRGHSLPETEWIIPEEITVPKKASLKECDPELFVNGHQVARRRISTISNIYYDLETVQSIETDDDPSSLSTSDSNENDKYKKNLQKFLGIPAELKDPLSAPPSLPARPKSLPQTIKKTSIDGRYSLRDAVFQTLKRNQTKENSESITEENLSDDNSELDDTKMSPSAPPHLVQISSWPIDSSPTDPAKSKKVELQNQLYSNMPNIYMNQKVIDSSDNEEICSDTEHIYAVLPEHVDDSGLDLKHHAKSLGDLLKEFEKDQNDSNIYEKYSFSSANDLTSGLQQQQSAYAIYENVSCLQSQLSLSSSDSQRTTENISPTPSSSRDSIYLSMNQLQLNSSGESISKINKMGIIKKSSHILKHDYVDRDSVYMDMGPPPTSYILESESENIYENFDSCLTITQRL